MDENNVIAVTETIQIPLSEIEFRFSPSRGPGGQHVNRAHTRVTLLFDVAGSPSLDEPTRDKLLQALATRLNKRGVLQIVSQDSRSQSRNRHMATARFVTLLNKALEERPQRVPTRPSKKVHKKRLEEKKKQSQKKQERGKDWSRES